MRPTVKLVPDFIVPHLDRGTFGRHLQWEEKEKGSFRISRVHQSSEHWNDDCFQVYKAWSSIKRLWKWEDPKRITKAKHRLVTALRRNMDIEMLRKETPYYRFRIINRNILGLQKSSDVNELSPKTTKVAEADKETSNYEVDGDIFASKLVEKYLTASDDGLSLLPENGTMHRTFRGYSKTNDSYLVRDITPPLCPPTDEKEKRFNTICCCDILLDGFLPNDMCIWHGVPP
ncbi:uncharacterized protein LOC129227825 [Uloborus diversus]|uniref:uncharacterized protein LOC129227825 n=1 Tax=Uloborus diversus TaxID=327109 RepID=UPI002409E3DC|nr:uncharacterized protein LOC129227825 [Uloborus diversus]